MEFENITSIFVTTEVSKFDKFSEKRAFKSEKRYDISVIFVLTFDNFKYFNEIKLLNNSLEKMRFSKLKFYKSKDIKELQPANIDWIFLRE